MDSNAVKRIEGILHRINTHPEYSALVKRERLESIRTEAARHSYGIERRSAEDAGIVEERDPKVLFTNIISAWNYLGTYGIDVHSLASLKGLIEPSLANSVGYRKKDVNLGIPFQEVPFAMENLAADLNEPGKFSPIPRAIHAHLEFVKIHPYEDGNGRAARLLENFCLEQNGYPSIVIPTNEKDLYMRLLKGSLNARFKEGSTTERPLGIEPAFHEYVTSKILNSAEILEDDLKKRRIYDLTIEGFENPGILESVKKSLRGIGRKSDREGLVVTVNSSQPITRKSRRLEVRGDVGLEELDNILEQTSNKYGLTYKCKVRTGCY